MSEQEKPQGVYDPGQSFKDQVARQSVLAGTSFAEALKDLANNRVLCVGCFLEVHAGQRETANPAMLVVGGNSTCREHLQITQGPVLPGRSPSGLILGQ